MVSGAMGKVDSRWRTWSGSTNEPLALFGHGTHALAPVDVHDGFVNDGIVEDILLCRHNEVASGRLNPHVLLLEERHTEDDFRMVEWGDEKWDRLPRREILRRYGDVFPDHARGDLCLVAESLTQAILMRCNFCAKVIVFDGFRIDERDRRSAIDEGLLEHFLAF